LIRRRLEAMRAGETEEDDPDPVESFRSQWLNQWPRHTNDPKGVVEPLLPDGVWADLAVSGLASEGPVWVAVEDDYGLGSAVAATTRLDDGRIEVDGWLCDSWDAAVADVQLLAVSRQLRGLLVGASMIDRVPAGLPTPQPAAGTLTRNGLAVFRDLAMGGQLVHDETTLELDDAIGQAGVKEAPSGLFLLPRGATHLVRAAVWAVSAAHRPTPVAAIF
jgi:hypothetical protein